MFEFFPLHERLVSESEEQMILFREKVPRRLADGTWECIYCLIDGSVHRINRAHGNFSDFELLDSILLDRAEEKEVAARSGVNVHLGGEAIGGERRPGLEVGAGLQHDLGAGLPLEGPSQAAIGPRCERGEREGGGI